MPEDSYPFAMEQALSGAEAVLALERRVLGCDYGGSSWTTRTEAEESAERLQLGPGTRLLDLGAGTGWPGLYLARLTGCSVTLADVPLDGLRQARRRAVADGVEERTRAVAADAAVLPFAQASFDALEHADVLCCMPAKRAMLAECRRVVGAGAPMLFTVIAPARDLAADERTLVESSGPPHVMVDGDYTDLLAESGWRVVERDDVTASYRLGVETNLSGLHENAGALRNALGPEEYTRRVRRRTHALEAIGRGLLKREIFLARAI